MKTYDQLIDIAYAHNMWIMNNGIDDMFYFSWNGTRVSPLFYIPKNIKIEEDVQLLRWMRDNLSNEHLIHNLIEVERYKQD